MAKTSKKADVSATESAVATVKAAKTAVEKAARKRFSFGPVWNQAVIAGTVKDTEKLVAQGVKLKLGTKDELAALSHDSIQAKVAAALEAGITGDEKTEDTTAASTETAGAETAEA